MKQLLLIIWMAFWTGFVQAQKKHKVVAYYSGDSTTLMKYDFSKITHLIYAFAHLDSVHQLAVFHKKDSSVLRALEKIKTQNPHLKTLIALGGWGGCRPCSETFDNADHTLQFAQSTKRFLQNFGLDGIDLDWEYPAIPGVPGHPYKPQDRENFTRLVGTLRKVLGSEALITFAAGGFQNYLDKSVDWWSIEPHIDFVNMMTYDLVHGYSTISGHQSALYNIEPELESVDKVVQFFKRIQFPLQKIIIGVPFYVRNFKVENTHQQGLGQSARFIDMRGYRWYVDSLTTANGFTRYWDDAAQVSYWLNTQTKIFSTGDDAQSIGHKIDYIKKHQLGGIMFWELFYDTHTNGLLQSIRFK